MTKTCGTDKKNALVARYSLLYVLGGRRAFPRVDVSVLFRRCLAESIFDIDWVVLDPNPSKLWRFEKIGTDNVFFIGKSSRTTILGTIREKMAELIGDFRVFGMALTGRYDAIQVRDKFLVALFCLFAARLRKTTFFYWLSYPFPESRVLDAREGRARFPIATYLMGKASSFVLYRLILPRADHVFVQSRQMLEDVHAEGIPLESMTAVPMGIDAQLLAKPKQPTVPGLIIYLGTLARVRRLDILLDAMLLVREQVPEARLVFIGEGDCPADRQFLEDRVSALGLEGAVSFTGQLPIEEALERTGKASVCVSPFYPTFVLRSTSPTKIVEYLALGKPVVANDHPEQALVIEKSQAGVCVAWSAEGFAEGILRIVKDPIFAEACSRNGPEYVGNHRTYDVISSNVAAKYREVLARR